MSDTDHTIYITGHGGAYLVAVIPPEPTYEPQLFADHRSARGFAGGIRLCRRWPIHDQTLEASHD